LVDLFELCNTYCFSTARTRLNITLYVRCLPCNLVRVSVWIYSNKHPFSLMFCVFSAQTVLLKYNREVTAVPLFNLRTC